MTDPVPDEAKAAAPEALAFDLSFTGGPGECVQVSPLVRRIVAGNSGPFTFTGTCSYIVGRGEVAIIDPGPDLPHHIEALKRAVEGEVVSHIVVSHTHRDHSPAARPLADWSGAPIVGCGPHVSARPLVEGETNTMESSGDRDYLPDRHMYEGDSIAGPGWTLTAIETPGHTANHLCFALPEEKSIFCADQVMAWSTTFVGPPDGSMTDYMASLDKLRQRPETLYWPGHGGPVREPHRFLRALIHHRRQREASILGRLAAGDRTIPAIVAAIYQGLAPALQRAAGLSVFAHLEDLVGRGLVATEGEALPESEYWLAG